jgi:hypothetical protein
MQVAAFAFAFSPFDSDLFFASLLLLSYTLPSLAPESTPTSTYIFPLFLTLLIFFF